MLSLHVAPVCMFPFCAHRNLSCQGLALMADTDLPADVPAEPIDSDLPEDVLPAAIIEPESDSCHFCSKVCARALTHVEIQWLMNQREALRATSSAARAQQAQHTLQVPSIDSGSEQSWCSVNLPALFNADLGGV
jgi:hypothetical protein